MECTAADFRARRETLGLSQSDVAKASGVKVLTVKRWESGESRIPQDVWEWLVDVERYTDEAVSAAVESIRKSGMVGTVYLTYYRTQLEYDAFGRDNGPFGVANANSRAVAQALKEKGYVCRFRYPGESEEIQRAKEATR